MCVTILAFEQICDSWLSIVFGGWKSSINFRKTSLAEAIFSKIAATQLLASIKMVFAMNVLNGISQSCSVNHIALLNTSRNSL